MNLQSNDFELFGLPEQFVQDDAAIDAAWKRLQREVHPDRFAGQGALQQRLALQWSVRINEAHRRLKNPIARAAYLCELRGAPIDAERNTAMPPAFLMEQMRWREALEQADSEAQIVALERELSDARTAALEQLARLLDRQSDADADAAAQQVRGLMFVERFARDVRARREQQGQ